MSKQKFPEGWDEARVRRVADHYDSQSDEAGTTEDREAYESITHTAMEVPVELVPEVRRLISKRRAG